MFKALYSHVNNIIEKYLQIYNQGQLSNLIPLTLHLFYDIIDPYL